MKTKLLLQNLLRFSDFIIAVDFSKINFSLSNCINSIRPQLIRFKIWKQRKYFVCIMTEKPCSEIFSYQPF